MKNKPIPPTFQTAPLKGVTREYFIGAREVLHEYADLKRNFITGEPSCDEGR